MCFTRHVTLLFQNTTCTIRMKQFCKGNISFAVSVIDESLTIRVCQFGMPLDHALYSGRTQENMVSVSDQTCPNYCDLKRIAALCLKCCLTNTNERFHLTSTINFFNLAGYLETATFFTEIMKWTSF